MDASYYVVAMFFMASDVLKALKIPWNLSSMKFGLKGAAVRRCSSK